MQLEQVKVGSVICNKGSGMSYIVTNVFDGSITAVRVISVMNMDEWDLVSFDNDLLEVVELAANIGAHDRAVDRLNGLAKAAIARRKRSDRKL